MLTGSLVPSAMGAPLRSRGRMPFAFGTRFFVALLLGLIWLVPAWWTPRLIAAMFLWDAFVIAAWFWWEIPGAAGPLDRCGRRLGRRGFFECG